MRRMSVLYVEDEEADVLFMRRAFQGAAPGHELHSVANGRDAIAYLTGRDDYSDRNRHPLPSLLLLDLNLPGLSGFEVLKWVRAQPEFEQLPVVVFSSSTRPEDKALAVDLGADEYIEKPPSGHQFVKVVEQLRERWL